VAGAGRLSSAVKALHPRSLVSRLARALGFVPRDGRQFLLEMLPRHAVCAEIGVHTGDFSKRILQTTSPRELHLIDPWRHETSDAYRRALYGGEARGGQAEMDERYRSVCTRFQSDIRSGRVRIHRGDSNAVLAEFPEDYFDWAYIDGNHRYEFVTADLALCVEKVKPGGYIAGDDYTDRGWWQQDIVRAVDEFVATTPVRVILKRNRQYLLQRA